MVCEASHTPSFSITGQHIDMTFFSSSSSLSCAYGIYLLMKVTSSRSASETLAWKPRMCVSSTTWRFMTALALELGEFWGGETSYSCRPCFYSTKLFSYTFTPTAFVPGFVVPPSHQTWPPLAPTWQWCLWLMREWLTAASTQHTRLYLYWAVSNCFCQVYFW